MLTYKKTSTFFFHFKSQHTVHSVNVKIRQKLLSFDVKLHREILVFIHFWRQCTVRYSLWTPLYVFWCCLSWSNSEMFKHKRPFKKYYMHSKFTYSCHIHLLVHVYKRAVTTIYFFCYIFWVMWQKQSWKHAILCRL